MMQRTIWDMCQETFGSIPARWRARLEAMEVAFTPAQLEEAFAIARHHKAKSIEYVVEVLGGLREQAAAASAEAAAASAAGAAPDKATRLRCDRCPRTEYVDRMTVHAGQAICDRCAEEVRSRGASNPAADVERVVVGRERLLELRMEEPCRIVGTPLRCNETPAETAWEVRWFRLARDVHQAVRRKAPYMPQAQLEGEMRRLLDERIAELGRYPARPDPLWSVLLELVSADRPGEAAGGAAGGADRTGPPMTAAARYVAGYWASVSRRLGVELTP